MIHDFAYVDDNVESIVRFVMKPSQPYPDWNGNPPQIPTSSVPYQIFNIGNSSPVQLIDYIEALEIDFGITAKKNMMYI